jgi:predicted RNase H-like nuclease
VRFVGVDLAWGPNGRTGLAVVDGQGRLLDATQAHADAEIRAWLTPMVAESCVVAIDAPIIVRNATGCRQCERLVGRYFGAFHASCHASNTSNPVFAEGSRALRLAQALGLDIDPAATTGRRAIEVYPHPAIVALFDLPSIVRYKNKPGRDLDLLRAEMLRLITLVESLEGAARVPLLVRDCPAWRRIRRSAETASSKAGLGRVEDSLDAVVCAYIARLTEVDRDSVRVLGTVDDGYIVTPVTARLAARIDADSAAAARDATRDATRGAGRDRHDATA